MSEPHTVCEELCSRSICSYKGSDEPDCFAKLPKVQKQLHKLVASSPAKLRPGESSTPFSKDFVWVKTGSGAFGTVHRCRNRVENLYRYPVKELLLSATPHGINSITEVLQEVEATPWATTGQGEKHVLLQGTLEYLAPEVLDQWTAQSQGREPAPCDPASADMWSMGVVLFEVYTCKNPFRGRLVASGNYAAGTRHSCFTTTVGKPCLWHGQDAAVAPQAAKFCCSEGFFGLWLACGTQSLSLQVVGEILS
ncbi:TPA: putative serine/threonine-protein kinase iks1 [Trebouxia sp. C0005]